MPVRHDRAGLGVPHVDLDAPSWRARRGGPGQNGRVRLWRRTTPELVSDQVRVVRGSVQCWVTSVSAPIIKYLYDHDTVSVVTHEM